MTAVQTQPVTFRERRRAVLGYAATVLSGLFVLAVLIVPGRPDLTPSVLLRVPVEGLLGLALLLVLRGRWRVAGAVVLGVLLGLWAVVRVFDFGFQSFLARPFDPVHDWRFLSSAMEVAGRSLGGRGAAIALAGAIAVLVVALAVLAVLRLARVLGRHRVVNARVLAALTVVWVVGAATGVDAGPAAPVAARDVLDRLGQVRLSLNDPYPAQLANDAFHDTPGADLLTALRGKNVVFVLVESYGRAALEHPDLAPTVGPVLDEGTARLAAAGFQARSAFLTSPTVGGGSWLAAATLLSGTWVANQDRYDALATSDRVTLSSAFHRAGWHTVAVMPGVTTDWPEGAFYGFDEVHPGHTLGYAGPVYTFDSVPDQYVLSYLQRTALPGPVMAVVPLLSSHAPWSPVPPLLDWASIGDGAVFPEPTEPLAPAEAILQRGVSRVRADYAHAISYSVDTLVSYVETYGDDDLVLVFLGDHQPAPLVTDRSANHDAPVSIVARDPAVLARLADWGWATGLHPGPDAPVWGMDQFRDRFLTTFQ